MTNDLIRIIIVDDHQQVRETWKMILNFHPRFSVVAECASGAAAIDVATSIQPDIMLMDINMSPVNGFEATRKIMKQSPKVKIIGISINNQPTYARNMMQLGAKGYVTKNSSKEEMFEAILTVHEGKTFICHDVKNKMDDSLS